MKMLKPNQIGPWCDWCPPKSVRAVWRSKSMTLVSHACDNHTDELKRKERTGWDSGRMTEADYQTWGRL